VYDRENSGVPGNRECNRKKNDGEIQLWERGERKHVLEVRMCYKQRDTIEHVERM
jgi:hypothetical protein